MITNLERASRAETAVEAYGIEDDLQTTVMDLLVDLLHLASQIGLDPIETVNWALIHFDAERNGGA